MIPAVRLAPLLILAALTCASCATRSSDSAPAQAKADHLPPPFRAQELRAGIPRGTEIKLRVEERGKPPVIQHWVFTDVDDEGCTIHARMLAEDGSLLADEGSGRSTWAQLEAHGHFPAARTTRADSSIEVPAGRFDTWSFTVREDGREGSEKRLHFAPTLPGPTGVSGGRSGQ